MGVLKLEMKDKKGEMRNRLTRLECVSLFFILLFSFLPSANTFAQVDQGALWGKSMNSKQRPIPYPFLRENDIVWSTTLWKTIDLNEAFNQFIYFPIDTFRCDDRKSLAHVLWDGILAGLIPIYEDDELKVPIDNELFVTRYTKADTILLEIGYDDDDNELYETIIRPREFDAAEFQHYFLREVWFIGKQETRQDSRRIALAPVKPTYRKFGDDEQGIYLGRLPIFWVPMQNPAVRTVLAQHNSSYQGSNLVLQPSWDYVFVAQLYSAFITRESNVSGRSISSYLTGEDAIRESDDIEEKVFDIENDMWEY